MTCYICSCKHSICFIMWKWINSVFVNNSCKIVWILFHREEIITRWLPQMAIKRSTILVIFLIGCNSNAPKTPNYHIQLHLLCFYLTSEIWINIFLLFTGLSEIYMRIHIQCSNAESFSQKWRYPAYPAMSSADHRPRFWSPMGSQSFRSREKRPVEGTGQWNVQDASSIPDSLQNITVDMALSLHEVSGTVFNVIRLELILQIRGHIWYTLFLM